MVKKYIFCTNPSQLWFLWMLFGVFAIAWPFRKMLVDRPLMGWVVSIVLYIVGIVGGNLIPNVFCIWTACRYVMFFFIGMRIRVKSVKQEPLIIDMIPWYSWIVVDLVLFVGSIRISQQSGIIWGLLSHSVDFLLHILGASMAWTALQTWAFRINWRNNRIFKTLSRYSMSMYLFHQQIVYFTIYWLNGKINPYLHATINFAVALAGSFLISALLMKWKVTRVLIGEKS